MLASVSESFWSPAIWLPPNITWQSFDSEPGYAQFYDLAYPFPLAIVLIAVRFVVERDIFRPLGKSLKIKDTTYRNPEANPVLESAYVARQKDYQALSKAAGLTERQIEMVQAETNGRKVSRGCAKIVHKNYDPLDQNQLINV